MEFSKQEKAVIFEECFNLLSNLWYDNNCKLPELTDRQRAAQSVAIAMAKDRGFFEKLSKTERSILGIK